MKFYDHRMNGVDVRRILEQERRRVDGCRPWQTALELVSLVACIAAIVLLIALVR